MAEIIATGPEAGDVERRELTAGEVLRLGRAPKDGGWSIRWDKHISRDHADLEWSDGWLTVRRLPVARNPIVVSGEEHDEFKLKPGQQFLIGSTTFELADEPSTVMAMGPKDSGGELLAEHSFFPGDLKQVSFLQSGSQLEALAELPGILETSETDEELAARISGLLLKGIGLAGAAGVMAFNDLLDVADLRPTLMRWESRDTMTSFRPSRRLITKSLSTRATQVHVWSEMTGREEFTAVADTDWAFCVPLTSEACRGWCLYVAGSRGRGVSMAGLLTGEALKADLRFAELMSEFLGATRQVRRLENKQAHLTQFFSPTVLQTLDSESVEDELAPREMDITVLFCDVRGFSRKSEDSQNDLHALLKRVSEALGVMTRCIVKHGGIIADFQGDAALGFWGWPKPPEDGPLAACRTALEIQSEFRRTAKDPNHPLAGFQVGIGIAHGRAIAGKIGTTEQAKVGVFGPVVNLGSRLEGLTKQLRASILVDEHTAEYARLRMDRMEGRTRKLGTVRPYGMKTALTVSELLPSASAAGALTEEELAAFEGAVDSLCNRQWAKALELLDQVPYTDRTKDFLMIFIAQNAYEPPEGWDGVIQMNMK